MTDHTRLRHWRWLLAPPPLAIAIAGAFLYRGSLSYDLIFDDLAQFSQFPKALHWGDLPQFFLQNAWAHAGLMTRYYRPLFISLLMAVRLMGGDSASEFHFYSVFVYAVCVFCAWFWLRRLLADGARCRPVDETPSAIMRGGAELATASAATLLFALHPMHLETVAWVSGSNETLLETFIFAAFLACLRAWDLKSRAVMLLAVSLYLAASLTKELGLLLPIYLVAYRLFLYAEPEEAGSAQGGGKDVATTNPETVPARIRNALFACAPLALAWPLYFALRMYALRALSLDDVARYPADVVAGTSVWSLWFYAKKLVWPFPVAYFYDVHYVTLHGPLFLSALAGCLSVVLGLWLWMRASDRRECGLIAFAIIWGLVPILPTFDLANFWFHDSLHDRYAFQATTSLAILAVVAYRQIGKFIGRNALYINAGALVALTGLCVGYVREVRREMPYFHDNFAFFGRALVTAPHAGELAMANLATLVTASGEPAKVLPIYEELVRRMPNSWAANNNLAEIYIRVGRPADALPWAKRALFLKRNDNASEWLLLGRAELGSGDISGARDSLARAHDAAEHDPEMRSKVEAWQKEIAAQKH